MSLFLLKFNEFYYLFVCLFIQIIVFASCSSFALCDSWQSREAGNEREAGVTTKVSGLNPGRHSCMWFASSPMWVTDTTPVLCAAEKPQLQLQKM